MVFCSICKQNKETKNRWVVQEHSVDASIIRDFKICDACAAAAIKDIVKELEPENAEETIMLNRTGVVKSFSLNKEGELEITISMDMAKARKIFLEKIGES